MADRTPSEGDPVLHHGRMHEITSLQPRARLVEGEAETGTVAIFENDEYEVRGWAHELTWSEADQAFYLPGRVLCRDERALHEAVVGVWPRAENHLAARKYLDTLVLEFKEDVGQEAEADVSKAALVDVLQRRKVYDVPDGETWDEDDWRAHAERCLEHCREIRELRQEG